MNESKFYVSTLLGFLSGLGNPYAPVVFTGVIYILIASIDELPSFIGTAILSAVSVLSMLFWVVLYG